MRVVSEERKRGAVPLGWMRNYPFVDSVNGIEVIRVKRMCFIKLKNHVQESFTFEREGIK